MRVPVVGIGASAGGLEAFKLLLSNLPANTGLAFVLVQHLDRSHRSELTKILAGVSSIPVREAADGMEIEPNHLYVIPPDAALELENQALKITPRAPIHSGPHMPINQFLQSLAEEYGSRAIGVILSGAGTDGAAGLEAVKAAGGVTFAQDPATAAFDSMPRAAIAADCTDFILPPEAIACELTKLAHHPYIAKDEKTEPPEDPGHELDSILALLRDATGIEFALYRRTTLTRRIMRRLALCHIGSLREYRERIQNDPQELNALHRDFLISVTRFFREPESFSTLRKLVFPHLVRNRPANAAIRIWVAGCATGEEAYSIAISLQEFFEETGHSWPVQIFASDISATAIDEARTGKYPEIAASEISPLLLDRHFSKIRGGYMINTKLREMCVFSRHDLLADPPFSKLDLISCRNTLMYLGNADQAVIARFHYALKPGGFLVLEPSQVESDKLFSTVAGAKGIYARNETAEKRHPPLYVPAGFPRTADKAAGMPAGGLANAGDFQEELERALLSRYRGAGVVVNRKLEVLEVVGQTMPYIALPLGKASLNFLRLVPETGLMLEVRKLIREAQSSGTAARRDRVPCQNGGLTTGVTVEVIPLGTELTRVFLILFESAEGVPGDETDSILDSRDRQISQLTQDVANAREELLALAEEHQHSSEESRSTVQGVVSANEDLQSLNEELETAKEELQAINEELTTLNQELLLNNAALIQARDFAVSIIATAASPLLVLDTNLRIETANASFYRMFGVSSGRVEGRLLYSVIKGFRDMPRLREMLEHILPDHKTIQGFEIERDIPGGGYKVLLVSARQLEGVNKVLLGIEDITEIKGRAAAQLRESDERFTNLADAAPVMIWVSGLDKRCTFFNKYWLEFTGRSLQQELGHGWTDSVHPEDLDHCLNIYSSSFDAHRSFQMEYRLRRKDGEYRWLFDTGVPRIDPDGVFSGYIGSCVDITDLKNKQEKDLAKEKLESVGALAEGIVHDFNNLLGGIIANAELALEGLATGSPPGGELARIRAAGLRGAEIARQLMVFAGQENDVSETISISGIVEDILDLLKVSVSKQVIFEADLRNDIPPVRANPSQLRQLVMNLISNASEAIGDRAGVIRVATGKVAPSPDSSLKRLPVGDYVQLEVIDTGRGMTPEVQARIFDPFFTTKLTGSHGHGLMVVHRIVQRLQGEVQVSSAPGKGTTFRVFLPGESIAAPAVTPMIKPAKETPGFSDATILLVDDEELLRQAVSKMLRKHGFLVMEAGDGSAALDLIRVHKDAIDLLLLDVNLPGASGRRVYEEAGRTKPDLPVIAISANSEEMAGRSLAARPQNFLRKPFLSADLIDKIQNILASRARGAATT